FAPAKQRHLHRGEVIWTNRIEIDVVAIAVQTLPPLYGDVGSHIHTRQNRDFGCGNSANPWQGSDPFVKSIDQRNRTLRVIAVKLRLNGKCDQVLRRKTEILLAEIPKCAGKKRCARQ